MIGLAAIAWQTFLGLPVLEWSVLSLLASGCFLTALAAGGIALRQSAANGAWRELLSRMYVALGSNKKRASVKG